MFVPKTDKIDRILSYLESRKRGYHHELNTFFSGNLGIYIDFNNIQYWQEKLGWKFDVKRMKQFFDSFDNQVTANLYHGTIPGNSASKSFNDEIKALRYKHVTKDVKNIPISIDMTSIDESSSVLLKSFIKKVLLRELTVDGVISINNELRKMNARGITTLWDKKCNFDIEMSYDMITDSRDNTIDCFMVWTADTDFVDTIKKLLENNKKVILVTTAGKPSREFNELISHKSDFNGLHIFEVKKIKEFLCKNADLGAISSMKDKEAA